MSIKCSYPAGHSKTHCVLFNAGSWPAHSRARGGNNHWDKTQKRARASNKKRTYKWGKRKQNTGHQEMRKPCKWAGCTEIMWRDPKKGVRPISLCCRFFPNTPAHQGARSPRTSSQSPDRRAEGLLTGPSSCLVSIPSSGWHLLATNPSLSHNSRDSLS